MYSDVSSMWSLALCNGGSCLLCKRLCVLVPFMWYRQLQRKLEFQVLVTDLKMYITCQHNLNVITFSYWFYCFIVWLQAFNTLVSNALDLATLNSVGDFILFLGKCSVTAATGCIGLIIMKQNSHLHFYAVPTIVVCIFAYFIAHSVLSLYEVRNTFCVFFFMHVVISPFFSPSVFQ